MQEVKMFHSPKLGVIMMFDDKSPAVGKYAIAEIAKNDGLTVEEFTAFFVPNTQDMWHGRLIHWTEKRY
ncbi:MAG: hypothetical protein EBR82_17525 [Caulobacteraceae bacterium]|nr:hypothetical protein [Caulobacteraceae bacterium]